MGQWRNKAIAPYELGLRETQLHLLAERLKGTHEAASNV